jgi:hypothetical protein
LRSALLVLLLLAACAPTTYWRGHFDVVSPDAAPQRHRVVSQRVSGRACWSKLDVATGGATDPGKPLLQQAVDAAIASAPGANALAAAEIWLRDDCYVVEGTAWEIR